MISLFYSLEETTLLVHPRPQTGPKLISCLGMTLLALAIFTLNSHAVTYFVRKDGNDSNNGLTNSDEGAWLTIQQAANTMNAGDSVNIGPGSYGERVVSGANGTTGSPITYTGNRDTTIVGAWYISHAYIVIDGCTVDGSEVPGAQGEITLATGADNNIVRNVLMKDSPYYGYYQMNAVTNCLLENSRIENPRSHAVTLNGAGHSVRQSYFHSRLGADVFRVIADNSIIADNFIDNWGNPKLTSGSLQVGTRYQWFDVTGSPDFSNVGAGAGPYTLNAQFVATATTPLNWGTGTATVQNTNHTDLYQSFSVGALYHSQNVIVERNLHINCDESQIGNFEDQASADPYNTKSVSNWTFRNNVFVNVSSQMNGYIEDLHWFNNTFVRCSYLITGGVLYFNYSGLPDDPRMRGNSHGAIVKNNIFYHCGTDPSSPTKGGYYIAPGNTSVEADNNLVVGTGAGAIKTNFVNENYEANGINGNDPLFVGDAVFTGSPRELVGWDGIDQTKVRALAARFKVIPESPARDTGAQLNELFTDDFETTERGGAWNIGAFDGLPSTIAKIPAPPSGITATEQPYED